MLKRVFLLIAIAFSFVMTSCEKDVVRNDESIIPEEFEGRDNEVIGELEIESREVTISLWDHGAIDGDIVSIYVNGKEVASEISLKSPTEKYTFTTELDFEGYNYILMFAHNEGSLPPNTAAISIDDGVAEKEFLVESSLDTNGTWDIVVN